MNPDSPVARAKPPGRHVAYLNLDYGIDLCGTKGASVHLRSICRAMARLGHRVTIWTARHTGKRSPFKQNKIAVNTLAMPDIYMKLRRELRETYGRRLNIPFEVRQCAINRDAIETLTADWSGDPPNVVMERLSLMGVAGIRAARAAGIPHVLEVNALISEEARKHRGLSDVDSARAAEDEVLAEIQAVFTVSDRLREALIERGVEPEKIFTIPNGYDETVFKPGNTSEAKSKMGLSRRFVVGLAGSMKVWHGVETLLKGFRMFSRDCPNATLLLIGEGSELATVESFGSKHPELHIVTTGGVSHRRVAAWLAACDVAVAPYEADGDFYFSPMKIYEYMGMAKPVVATRQGQIRQVIRHGENGLLFKPGDHLGLRRMLKRLWVDPAIRRRLGRNGHASVQNQTWLMNARRMSARFEELIGRWNGSATSCWSIPGTAKPSSSMNCGH